jgi:hypothetical protein
VRGADSRLAPSPRRLDTGHEDTGIPSRLGGAGFGIVGGHGGSGTHHLITEPSHSRAYWQTFSGLAHGNGEGDEPVLELVPDAGGSARGS